MPRKVVCSHCAQDWSIQHTCAGWTRRDSDPKPTVIWEPEAPLVRTDIVEPKGYMLMRQWLSNAQKLREPVGSPEFQLECKGAATQLEDCARQLAEVLK